MRTKQSGKARMYKGILQFLWAELLTLNKAKFSGLYKIITGYFRMKYFNYRKRLDKRQQDRETTYRLSS